MVVNPFSLGFNNANHGDHAVDINKGIQAIIKSLHEKVPNTKVLLLSILPSGHKNHVIHETNKLLAHQENKKTVFFLDLTTHYETTPEHINDKLFVADKIHLTKEG